MSRATCGCWRQPRLARTDEWQAGEQQISEDRAASRRGPVFASGDEFLAALRQLATTDGPGGSGSR